MTRDIQTKTDLLHANNYKYDWEREIYYNSRARKIISLELFNKCSFDKLTDIVNKSIYPEWEFAFIKQPTKELQSILIGLCL